MDRPRHRAIRTALALPCAAFLAFARPADASTSPSSRNTSKAESASFHAGDPSDRPVVRSATPDVDLDVRRLGTAAVGAGDTASFTIQIANFGTAAARDVRITDQVPDGFLFAGASGGGLAAGNLIEWPAIPVLEAGEARAFTIRLVRESEPRARAANPAGSPGETAITPESRRLSLAGGVSPTRPFSIPSAFSQNSTIAATADLGVTTSGVTAAAAGSIVEFVITYRNNGPDEALEAGVEFAIPAGASFVDATNGGVATAGVVRWPAVRRLGSDHARVHTVNVRAPACAGAITGVSTVAGTSPPDPVPANNVSAHTVTIAGPNCPVQADVAITITAPLQAFSLDSIVYTISTKNDGPEPAFGVVVTDTVPDGSRVERVSHGGSVSGRVVSWPAITRLAPGEGEAYEVVYRAPVGPGQVTATAAVTSAAPYDADLSNNAASVVTLVGVNTRQGLDLRILKTGPASVSGGDTIIYRLTVWNDGPDAATGVVVTDSVPGPGTFVSTPMGSLAGGVVTWPAIPSLAAGASVMYEVRWRAPACPATLRNVGLVVDGQQADTLASNNRSEVTTTVGGCAGARIELVKEAVDTFRLGGTGRFRFTVRNSGSVAQPGPIEIEDVLPAGLVFQSASGPGWAVTSTTGVFRAVHAGPLAAGGSTTLELVVRIGAGAVPGFCNRATARAGILEVESAICVVVDYGELTLAKRALRAEAAPGDIVEYRLVVGVTGNTTIAGIRVADTLPAGFRYVAGTTRRNGVAAPDPAGGSAPVLTFDAGTVAAGDSAVIMYRVRIGAAAEGERVNRARASGDGRESETATSRVLVGRGQLSDEGLIAGRVWLDAGSRGRAAAACACEAGSDLTQGSAEPGIPGVRVWLQDGTTAITDGAGRYLFEGVRARTWVVRIDEATLPDSLVGIPLGNRHADNGFLVQVDLKRGELGRADFAAGPGTASARAEIERRRRDVASTDRLEAAAPGDRRSLESPRPAPIRSDYVGILPTRPRLPAPFRAGGFGIRADSQWGEPVRAGAGEVPSAGPAAAPTATPAATRHLAIGLLEVRVDRFRNPFAAGVPRDRFEDALRAISADDGDRIEAGARAAVLYSGTFSDGFGVTLRLDSEADDRARFFGDIRPFDGYPIHGDASVRQFGAQSRSRFFGRIEKGASALTWGDFNTAGAAYGQAVPRQLGEYGRTLNGVIERFESRSARVTGFASRNDSRQVVDVLRGGGISGPYALSRRDGLVNSERIELVTRDRDQPAVVLRTEALERFTDYSLEPLTGRLVFQRPVPMVDDDFNPVEIRITYEVEGSGADYWVWGGNGQVRPTRRLELGGSFVRDDAPGSRLDLGSINATVDLGAGTLLAGEYAATDSGAAPNGDAARLELSHSSARLAGRAWWLRSDENFANPSSPCGSGREEAGVAAAFRSSDRTRLTGEWLSTRDRLTEGRRDGGRIGIDAALTSWLTGGIGYRRADESATPAFAESGQTPATIDAIGIRLAARRSGDGRASAFAEYEQDISDPDRRRAVIGADYRVMPGLRLYGRHELISSLTGPWGLDPDLERNATVFGLAAENRTGQAVFSEYRVGQGIAGRDAQAAIGLRNRWQVSDGLRISSSIERQAPLFDGGRTATALAGAAEFTGSPDWKGSARTEFRDDGTTDNLFGSLGYVRRVSSEFSLLGSLVFSTALDGGRAFERTRIGIAWRQADANRWNALARWEHRYDRDTDPAAPGSIRTVQLLGSHADFRPVPSLTLRGEWLTKLAKESSGGISTNSNAHIGGARATFDILTWLDAGILGRALFTDGFGEARYGAGAEVGVRLVDNLRIVGGYNVFGFHDRDVGQTEYTERGFHVGIGYAFDEGLFGRGGRRCACPGGAPGNEQPPPGVDPPVVRPPEGENPPPVVRPPVGPVHPPIPVDPVDPPRIDVSISGPSDLLIRSSFTDTLVYVLSSYSRGRGTIDSMIMRVHTSVNVTLIGIRGFASADSGGADDRERGPQAGTTGSDFTWWIRRPFPINGGHRTDTLRLVVDGPAATDSLFRVEFDGDIRAGTWGSSVRNRFETRLRRIGCTGPDCPAEVFTSITGPNRILTAQSVRWTITIRNIGGQRTDTITTSVGPAPPPTGGPIGRDSIRLAPVIVVGPIVLEPGESRTSTYEAGFPDLNPSIPLVAWTGPPGPAAEPRDPGPPRPPGPPGAGPWWTCLAIGPVDSCVPAIGPVVAEVDLETRIEGPAFVTVGGSAWYRVRTRNIGATNAHRVVHTAIVSGSLVEASGNASLDNPTWAILELPIRGERVDSIRIACPSPGRISIDAIASVAGLELPRDNNRARREAVCGYPPADVSVTVAGIEPAGLRAGALATWSVSVTNRGQGPAGGLRVVLDLPPGFRFEDGGGSGTITDRSITWIPGETLVTGETLTRRVVVRVPADTGTFSGEARVTSSTGGPRATFGFTSWVLLDGAPDGPGPTPPEPPATMPPDTADLQVRIAPVGINGNAITYVLTTSNIGGLAIPDARVSARWPGRGRVRSVTGPATLSDTVVVWPARAIPGGGTIADTFEFNLPFARLLRDSVRLEVLATTLTQPERNPANNGTSRMVYLVQDTLRRSVVAPTGPGGEVVVRPDVSTTVLLILIALAALAGLVLASLIYGWLRGWRPGGGLALPGRRRRMPAVVPLPAGFLREVISYVEIEGSRGTGYLIAPDRFVTCAHVIRNRPKGESVSIRFKGEWMNASIESIDTAGDVAVLRLPRELPDGHPIALSVTIPGRVEWQGMGFPHAGAHSGNEVQGVILQASARNRWGDHVMIVSGPNLVNSMLAGDTHAWAGSPVIVGGRVVGHLRGPVRHPDSMARAFGTLLEVVPLGPILACTGRGSPEDWPDAIAFSAYPGRSCSATLVYDAADAVKIRHLAHRLEGAGVRMRFATAGSSDGRSDTDFTIHAYGRSWQQAPRPPEPGAILLSLDDRAIPEAWRSSAVIDARNGMHGDAFRSLVRVLLNVPEAEQPALNALTNASDAILAEIEAAGTCAERIRGLALRWQETGIAGYDVALVAAERLLEAGRPEWAFGVVEPAPAGPCSAGLRARALALLNRIDEAAAALEALGPLESDPAHLEQLGELDERRATESARPDAYRRRAFDALSESWKRGQCAGAGLRALVLALQLGRPEDALSLAAQIRSAFESKPRLAPVARSALAGAYLLLGDEDAAAEAWSGAVSAAPDDVDGIGRMLRAARAILAHVKAGGDATSALEAKLSGILAAPAVAALVRPVRGVHRPVALADGEEARIRGAMREQLEVSGASYGVCGGADVIDVLFVEEMAARSGHVRLVLAGGLAEMEGPNLEPAVAQRLKRLMTQPRVTVEVCTADPLAAKTQADVFTRASARIEAAAIGLAREWGARPLAIFAAADAGQAIPAAWNEAGAQIVRLEGPSLDTAQRRLPHTDRDPAALAVAGSTRGEVPVAAQVRDVDGMFDETAAAGGLELPHYRKRHCIAIGINQYAEWRPLANAVNDATRFAQKLERDFDFHTDVITDRDATRERIRELFLDVLPGRVAPDDLVVFFFAGHGHTERRGDDAEHGYLVPVGARLQSIADLLPMQEVVSWTEDLACHNVLYIFDSCFSGFAALAGGVTRRGHAADARVAIAAGSSEQVVLDGGAPAGYENHSVFTGHLLLGLDSEGRGDEDAAIDDMKLFVFLRDHVRVATKGKQTPVYGPLSGHGTGGIWLYPEPTGES